MGKNKLKIGEFSRLGCECPEPGYSYAIEHGGYKPQDIDIEYCEKEGYSIVGAPRACYVDGIWNQEDADKWLTIIQVPVEKEIMRE